MDNKQPTGERNLTPEQRNYLIGNSTERESARGKDRPNLSSNEEKLTTAEKMAKEQKSAKLPLREPLNLPKQLIP